jgi:excisionase family DNA binding protein
LVRLGNNGKIIINIVEKETVMPRYYKKRPVPEPLLTTGEIARYCNTSMSQVKRWIQNEDLKAIQTPGGHFRIKKEDFRSFLERMKMPVIEDFFKPMLKKRILIADDDAHIVDSFSELLNATYNDVEIEVAYDGYETLIKTGDFKPDLLILDIRMPKIDGLEVCRRIRQENTKSRKIKILAMSAHSEEYERELVLKSGANEYLLKPISIENLIKQVNILI